MTHLKPVDIDRYTAGESSDLEADAIEHHLQGCAICRSEIRDPEWTGRSWHQVQTLIRTPRKSPAERLMIAIGFPDYVAHLIATSTGFRPSWWMSLVATLSFAGVAAITVSTNHLATLPFLAIAPILPVVGVALAYGIPGDPLTEITTVAPNGGFRLLLIRSIAVVASSSALGVTAALIFLPSDIAFIWLVPSLAATTLTLALATRIGTHIAAAVVLAGWFMLIGVTTIAGTTVAAFSFGPHVIVFVVAGAILAGTRNSPTTGATT